MENINITENEIYGFIYCISFPNGKKYIGQTTKLVEERIKEHIIVSKTDAQYLLSKAIRKYGEISIEYKSIDNATTPPIGSGNVVYNNAIQSLATVIYISHLTRDNVDIEIFFENVSSLNDLYIQDQNNSLNFIRRNVSLLNDNCLFRYFFVKKLIVVNRYNN